MCTVKRIILAKVKGKDDVKFSHHYYFREEKTGPGCLKTKYVTNLTVHTKRKTL